LAYKTSEIGQGGSPPFIYTLYRFPERLLNLYRVLTAILFAIFTDLVRFSELYLVLPQRPSEIDSGESLLSKCVIYTYSPLKFYMVLTPILFAIFADLVRFF